jgi:hypothetical protein
MFLTFSTTKALAHVLRLPGSDVRPCTGKMEAGHSRSDNKNSMTDSIENIQKRTAGAMSAASAGVCLAAASCKCKRK